MKKVKTVHQKELDNKYGRNRIFPNWWYIRHQGLIIPLHTLVGGSMALLVAWTFVYEWIFE